MITLVFNANSSQNIAKGNIETVQDTVVLHGLAPWLSREPIPIKVYRQWKWSNQDKTLFFFYLSLSRTRVSTKLLRPFSLYLQPSKLKFLLDLSLATYSFGLGRLFYKSSHQLQNFRCLMATKMVTTWRVDFMFRKQRFNIV